MKPFATVLLLLALAGPANAGNCGSLFRQNIVGHYAAVQQVVAVAQPYAVEYRVGQVLQDESIRAKFAEDIASRVVAKLQQAKSVAPAAASDPAPGTLGLKATVLASKCARCHSGDAPKGGLTLDGSAPVDDGTFRRVVEMLGAGRDVPKAMAAAVAGLKDTEKGAIVDELLTLKPKPEPVVAPPPAPAGEAGVLE